MPPLRGLGDGDVPPKKRAAKGAQRTCVQGDGYQGMAVEVCATWNAGTQLPAIRSSRDIHDRVTALVNPDAMVREHLGVLILDAKMRPIGYYIASLGTGTGAMADAQTVLRPVLIMPSIGLVLVHNHPSGDTNPSADDVAFTKLVANAARACGVKLIDHVIIARNGAYASFLDMGLLQHG